MNKLRAQGSPIALAFALVLSGPAFAQTTDAAQPGTQPPATAPADETAQPAETAPATDAPAAAADSGTAEIVVTGTSIRGVAPVGSDLIQLGRQDIENSTGTNVTAIIREVPQVFNFGVTDAARNQAGGAGNIVYGNSVNIRGIGPFATLTLINGRRPVGQGTLGASVDPNTIPGIALERVEIIADGASAVYGSDAVAGVANLILRRRYNGVGAEATYGVGDEFKDVALAGIVGHGWDSGRFTLSAQHLYRSALRGSDRDFYRADLTAFGGQDYRTFTCNPGNIVFGSGTSAVRFGIPATGATAANLIPGGVRCDNLKNSTDLLPQQEVNSGTFTFDQDITDKIKFFADGLYARRDGFRRSAVATQTLAVPNTNPFFISPPGRTLNTCPAAAGVPATVRCESIEYSFEGIYGPNATSEIRATVWQGTGGFDIGLAKDWNLNLFVTYGRSHDHVRSVGGNTDAANLAAALRSTDPATAFNPFGTTVNSQAVIDSIFDNITDTDGKTRVVDTGFRLDGGLFQLPGGEVKLAVGGEYYDMFLRTGQIRGRAGAQTGTDQKLSRNVASLYGEVFVPIFGDENAVPGINRLDISVAGRMDDYSDVGVTKNPKFGFNWRPVEDLKVHGSYGTSFRAPLLTNLVSAGGSQLFIQNYFDPTVGATIRGVAVSGGNLDLEPETARTYSLGVEYNPSWRRGAQLSLNYFNLVYEGQIASYLSNLNVLRQENLFSAIILRGAAAQARIAELLPGRTVNGGTAAEALAAPVFVEGRPSNLGITKTQGLDFGLVVPWTVESLGNFRFALRGIRFFNYKNAITPGGLVIDQLNNVDFPLKLRARGQLGYDSGTFRANLFANYQSAYNNTFSTLAPRIDSYTTFDLSLAYDLGRLLPLTKEAEIGLDVTNLFDKDPPFADLSPTNNGGGGFDPTTAGPIGRVIAATLKTRF